MSPAEGGTAFFWKSILGMERDWPTVWGQGSQFGPDAKVIPCVVICFPVPLKSVDVPLSGRYTDKPLVGA